MSSCSSASCGAPAYYGNYTNPYEKICATSKGTYNSRYGNGNGQTVKLCSLILIVLLLLNLLKPKHCPSPAPCPPPPPPPPQPCFPVEPEERDIPEPTGIQFLVNGINNPPVSFATIDDAITALGANDGTIVLDGSVFTPFTPAAAPTQPITTSVTLTSTQSAFPAVISNANLVGVDNYTILVASATPVTFVMTNITLFNVLNLVDSGYSTSTCLAIDGEHDVYVDSCTFKTNRQAIYSFNQTAPTGVGSQLQVTNCFFDGFAEFNESSTHQYILLDTYRGDMILSHNQIVGRKTGSFNEASSVFVILDAKNNVSAFSVVDNKSVNNFYLKSFIILNGIASVNQNIQVFAYENNVSTQDFIYSTASVFLDTFEFIATRDNVVNLIEFAGFQNPFIYLTQSIPAGPVVSNNCVLYSRNNTAAQTSAWSTAGLQPASTPTSAWNTVTPIADNEFFFAAYLESDFTPPYLLFPFASEIPCDSPLARQATSEARQAREVREARQGQQGQQGRKAHRQATSKATLPPFHALCMDEILSTSEY